MANVSKPISIPNEEFSDDTTPSVAQKFLNEVKSTIVNLQCVVKEEMTLDIHNWLSSVHQEIQKIIKDEIVPIVNQIDARLQNFEIQFLKEATKFVQDFKSLAKEADESLAKHKALELEIERLLRAVFRIFRINPFKPPREDKYVPNKVRASVRINLISVSQPHVITKKDVNSDSNGLSSIGVDNTAKTRRPQPRSNTKNDRVPSASKSSYSKNKEVENDKSKVVCAMCKQCLIIANHDVCVLNYVNDMNSRGKKQKANVSNTKNQKKQKPKVMKPKKVGSNKILASPKPSKPRISLRWSQTGRIFDLCGKIIESSDFKCKSDTSVCDDEYASNPQELIIKRFVDPTP
ncbi:hypothetical protein Tco_0011264 [Tanacetum coccineum]